MPRRIKKPLVDPTTGELIDTAQYVELEPGDVVISTKKQEFLQKKKARYQDQTDFIWLTFSCGNNLEFPVDRAVAVRFLYFGTACGADGIIQVNRLMTAKLNLDKNQQTTFLQQTLQSGLLRQKGSAFLVDQSIISRGEYDADSDHIRVFASFYRKLCESAPTQVELNRIYYFLQMIPYLNRQTNILSYNQTEQDPDRIACMSFKEFCKSINFNPAHSAKLKRQLLEFRVNGERVVGFFDNNLELSRSGKNVILNPKLCFGGDRTTSKYKEICALFENERNAHITDD